MFPHPATEINTTHSQKIISSSLENQFHLQTMNTSNPVHSFRNTMAPTNQASSFMAYSDLSAIAATYSARLVEVIYRHLRKKMKKDDDINHTVHEIMLGPPPALGSPSQPTNETAKKDANGHESGVLPASGSERAPPDPRDAQPNTTAVAVSSGSSPQHLCPSNNYVSQSRATSNCSSDRPSSLSSTAPLASAPPSSYNSSPVIPPTESPEIVTELAALDIGTPSSHRTASLRPPNSHKPTTLFNAIQETYEKRKVLERRRYCKHIRYQYETTGRPTVFEDAEIKALDDDLKSQVTLAETKLEEILANARYLLTRAFLTALQKAHQCSKVEREDHKETCNWLALFPVAIPCNCLVLHVSRGLQLHK